MRLLVAILLVVAALFAAVKASRGRAHKLHQLRNLVGIDQDVPRATVGEEQTIERFLPRNLARRLRLLGIPEVRSCGLAIAVTSLPVVMAGLYAGFLAALGMASAFLLTGLAVLNLLAARRVAELGVLLPGLFDRVRHLLIVGNSLPTAFVRAVQGAQPQLTLFFTPTLRRMSNGASFSESIQQSAEDIDLYEMRLFAAAVAANMRFGGSLTHSLNNLVSYLRKRASIERELRANTAQIRASAWILGLLPMLVAALIVFQNPDYARWFIDHPTGKRMLVYCILSQIVGACLMRAVVRTKF
jgi:tight adherence protein B